MISRLLYSKHAWSTKCFIALAVGYIWSVRKLPAKSAIKWEKTAAIMPPSKCNLFKPEIIVCGVKEL